MNASAKEKKAKGGDFAPIEHMALCDIMLALIAEKEKNGEQIHSQQKHTFSKSCRAEPGIVVGLGFLFCGWFQSSSFYMHYMYCVRVLRRDLVLDRGDQEICREISSRYESGCPKETQGEVGQHHEWNEAEGHRHSGSARHDQKGHRRF
jgi:hypothetical protein